MKASLCRNPAAPGRAGRLKGAMRRFTAQAQLASIDADERLLAVTAAQTEDCRLRQDRRTAAVPT
jgi:hypothetical protein